MKEILLNMANHLLIQFCKDYGIECSGTYVKKDGRGFTYSLRDNATGQKIVARITFHKSQVPTYQFDPSGHKKILAGECKICGHYGEDCTGEANQ